MPPGPGERLQVAVGVYLVELGRFAVQPAVGVEDEVDEAARGAASTSGKPDQMGNAEALVDSGSALI